MSKNVQITVSGQTAAYDRAMRRMELRSRKVTQNIKAYWLEAAGAVYGAMKGWELMKAGARAEQEAVAFRNMAASYGTSADKIVEDLKKVSAGAVDTATLIQKAGTAMMMGIAPEKLTRLMEIARATSKMTGQSVTKAFEDISLAVSRQSRMILDNLGIIVKVGQVNEEYAASLGKTAAELTDVEKKQAFLNATIEAGEQLMARMGKQTKTTAEMFQSFEALTKNVGIAMSQVLIKAVRWTVMVFAQAGAVINQTFEQIAQGWAYILKWVGGLPGGEALGFKALGEKAQAMADHFREAREEANRFTAELIEIGKLPPVVARPLPVPGGSGADDAEKKIAEKNLGNAREYYAQMRELLFSHHDVRLKEMQDAQADELAAQEKHHIDLGQVAEDSSKHMIDLSQRTAEAMEQNFSDFFFDVMRGEFKNLGDFALGVLRSIQRATADYLGQMAKIGLFGTGSGGGGLMGALGTKISEWKNVQAGGFNVGYEPFSKGGVVDGPTIFPMAGGMGLMGEGGREAVMPLTRLPGGDLGIKAAGGGMQVNIYNNTGSQVSVKEGKTASGGKRLDVLIDEIVAEKVNMGRTHKALRNTFGLSPALSGR